MPGFREWRIQQALAAYEQGADSLAFAAQKANVSLREIISAAYPRGLTPHIEGVDSPLSQASRPLMRVVADTRQTNGSALGMRHEPR